MSDLVCIKTYTTRQEAEVAKGFLQVNSINAIVSADDAGGTYPFPLQPTSTGVLLLVEQKNVEIAKKLLNQK